METITSINGNVTNSVNNHEEADTLLLHAMTLVKSLIDDSAVYVYSADTDVFFILLRHCDLFDCTLIFQHLLCGFVDIKGIYVKIGRNCAHALLGLHALTGCDTTGRFDGKTKKFWFRERKQWAC